jgi:hypothetical protein
MEMSKNKVMWNKGLNNRGRCRSRPGVVLLVTLVLLIMLSALGYTLSSRVAAQRHREQYIIDYQAARYGCDSASRYIFARLQDINTPQLVDRPNEPDFSDLFHLSEVEYRKLLTQWIEKNTYSGINSVSVERDVNDINNVHDACEADNVSGVPDFNDPNSLVVRGPYGPPWPLVIEPVELKIGSAAVRIEIEDEDAKYPLGWAMLDVNDVQREAEAGLKTFCEWMDINSVRIDSLKDELKGISEIKTFKLDYGRTMVTEEMTPVRTTSRSARGRRRTIQRRRIRQRVVSDSVHQADFAKLFHGSLIDTDALAAPTIVSESRKESALKYMGLWGSDKVNINTAPRQVLEAAFTFGGDADKIAEEIIQRRRIKPFTDMEDLRKSLFKYSDSIEKCEKYITTASSFFTVKITAVSGVAETSMVFAITKDGKKVEKIAAISG